ncbi:hypothetical protein D3C81_381220 [compost metagenome]
MADAQDRFGDRSDQSHVIGSLQNALVQGAGLVGFAQHVEGTLVGERLVADGQGEVYRDPAAIDPRVDVVGEGEHQRVTWAKGDGGRAVGVGVTRGQAPDAVEVQAAEVEQWQRQVSGELEVLVVAGYQVIAQAERDAVAGTQFRARRRCTVAIEVGEVDLHLAVGDAREGTGAVALVLTAEVQRVQQHGGGDGGLVTQRIAFVDFTVGVPRWWRIALSDPRLVADHREGRTLEHVIEGQVTIEPGTHGEGITQRLANVEDYRGTAVAIDHAAADQGNALGHAVDRQGQGGAARHQGLAVAQSVGDDEVATAQKRLAKGEVIGQGDPQVVGQRVPWADAGTAAVNRDGDLLLQGNRLGDETDILALAAEVDLAAGGIAWVQWLPAAGGAGTIEGNGDVIAAHRVDHRHTVGIVFGHEELHIGAGRATDSRVADTELADVEIVAKVAVVVLREDRLDQRRIGDGAAIVEGNGGQRAAPARGNGGDDDIVRHRLLDHDVGQGLLIGGGEGDVEVALEVGAGCRFTFRGGDHLIDGDHRRMHPIAVGVGRRLQDARVGGRIVQRVVAVLKAATGTDGQVWGRAGKGKIGVGQVTQACRYLDGDWWLTLADTGKG